MTKPIDNHTVTQLVETVRAVAAERPDHAPNRGLDGMPNKAGCRYFNEVDYETGVCIVGCALERQGVKLADLAAASGRSLVGDFSANASQFETLAWEIYPQSMWDDDDVNHNALQWLDNVQRKQDGGLTWAEAVEFADLQFSAVRQA